MSRWCGHHEKSGCIVCKEEEIKYLERKLVEARSLATDYGFELGRVKDQLEEARKSLGDSINYRVFNLTADEAVISLRREEQLKEKGK